LHEKRQGEPACKSFKSQWCFHTFLLRKKKLLIFWGWVVAHLGLYGAPPLSMTDYRSDLVAQGQKEMLRNRENSLICLKNLLLLQCLISWICQNTWWWVLFTLL